MPSQGSITKTIRLNAEDKASVEEIMRKEGCTWSGAIHMLISEGTHQTALINDVGCTPKNEIMSEETYKDLTEMCSASGLTLERFMDYIRRLFNDGHIYVDGITLKTKSDYDLRYLVDVCHRLNVDPQEMIDKLANSLVRR